MMDKKKLSRKEFLRLTAMGAVTAVASGLVPEKILAMQSLMDQSMYGEPAIGQPGYEKRVAKLFKVSGLPEKATSIR